MNPKDRKQEPSAPRTNQPQPGEREQSKHKTKPDVDGREQIGNSQKLERQRMDDDGGQTRMPKSGSQDSSRDAKSSTQRAQGTPDFGDQEEGDPRRLVVEDNPVKTAGRRENAPDTKRRSRDR
jgi:hypothetical protein